jgi:hypothetical protein
LVRTVVAGWYEKDVGTIFFHMLLSETPWSRVWTPTRERTVYEFNALIARRKDMTTKQ